MKTRQRRMSQERAKSLEEGWDDSRDTRIKEYNALFDPNMRHFFETPSVQGHLLRTGQIDRNGRVIDIQKQKGKLHIIEQEFKQAERIEYWRQKEERDMRERVQKKRAMALERARREEMVIRLHEDRLIRQEIVRAGLAAQGGLASRRPGTGASGGSTRSRSRTGGRSRSQQEDDTPGGQTAPSTTPPVMTCPLRARRGHHDRKGDFPPPPAAADEERAEGPDHHDENGGVGGRGRAQRCRPPETFVTEGGAKRPPS